MNKISPVLLAVLAFLPAVQAGDPPSSGVFSEFGRTLEERRAKVSYLATERGRGDQALLVWRVNDPTLQRMTQALPPPTPKVKTPAAASTEARQPEKPLIKALALPEEKK